MSLTEKRRYLFKGGFQSVRIIDLVRELVHNTKADWEGSQSAFVQNYS
jgi:hypothetical protein